MLAWQVTETPTDADLATISNGVVHFGRTLAVGGNPRQLACFVHEGETMVAGGSGRTEFSRLFVLYLWVQENKRNAGLGAEVLTKLEEAARDRDCRDSMIETLNDRTASLYGRLGYQTIAMVPSYVGSFNRHIMLKSLSRHGKS